MRNQVFTAMSPEELAACKTKLAELEAMLPENPLLTPIDRQRLAKMSYSGQTFVQEALSVSKDMPELRSSFVDLVQMENTFNFHQQMNELLSNIAGVQHWAEDLKLVSGAAADDMARACYKHIKNASEHQVESAANGYDRLRGRYVRKRRAASYSGNGNGVSSGSGT
jgi:hypothetical protein